MVFLRDDWALVAEPNTKEAVIELVNEFQYADEERDGLADLFGDGENFNVLLHRIKTKAERGGIYDEREVTRDFHLLLGALAFLERPGWHVGMTLMDDGRLTYAHRPMSMDEMLEQLVFAGGKDAVLRQVGSFVEQHDYSDQFRQFFFSAG